jgi:mannosyltransferase
VTPASPPRTATYDPPWPARLGLAPARVVWAVLAGAVLVGAALRFGTLGHQSFGHDEAVTVGRVLRPGLGATLREVGHSERTPYLYYLLAWGWTRIFGLGAVAIRSLSALFGTLTILVAFGAGRAAVSERTGVIAAALVAVDPFLVYYSQEARAYALLGLLAAGTLWAFARVLAQPGGRTLAIFSAVSVLAIATHYFALFLVGLEGVVLIATLRAHRRAVAAALAATAALALALVPLLAEQLGRQGADVDQAAVWRQVPTALVQFLAGERLSIAGLYTATPVLGALVLVAAIAICRAEGRLGRRRLAAVGGVGIAALLLAFSLELGGAHAFNARNCLGCLVALIVLLAGWLAAWRRRRAAAAAVAVLCVGGLGLSVALSLAPALERPDYRAAAAALGSSATGERALVLAPGADTVMTLYRAAHAPQAWPAAGAAVREIDVVSAAGGGSAGQPPGRAPAGFGARAAERFGTVRLTRFRASGPVAVTRTSLAAMLGGGGGGPTVLLETRG